MSFGGAAQGGRASFHGANDEKIRRTAAMAERLHSRYDSRRGAKCVTARGLKREQHTPGAAQAPHAPTVWLVDRQGTSEAAPGQVSFCVRFASTDRRFLGYVLEHLSTG